MRSSPAPQRSVSSSRRRTSRADRAPLGDRAGAPPLVVRDQHGRFVLGSRFTELAAAAGEDRLLAAAGPILQTLLDRTGESAQIYRRQGEQRVCIAAVERASGLRDSIPVGAMLSMEAGSAAQILLAWEDTELLHQGLRHAKFSAAKLATVRKRGWADSINERDEGVCSISAPIRNASRPGNRRDLGSRDPRAAWARIRATVSPRSSWAPASTFPMR